MIIADYDAVREIIGKKYEKKINKDSETTVTENLNFTPAYAPPEFCFYF